MKLPANSGEQRQSGSRQSDPHRQRTDVPSAHVENPADTHRPPHSNESRVAPANALVSEPEPNELPVQAAAVQAAVKQGPADPIPVDGRSQPASTKERATRIDKLLKKIEAASSKIELADGAFATTLHLGRVAKLSVACEYKDAKGQPDSNASVDGAGESKQPVNQKARREPGDIDSEEQASARVTDEPLLERFREWFEDCAIRFGTITIEMKHGQATKIQLSQVFRVTEDELKQLESQLFEHREPRR